MKTKIVQDIAKAPIAAEVIAQSVLDISKAMKDLNSTRLTKEAIVTLIHDTSRISKTDIRIVMNNLSEMERTWLK